MFIFVIIIISTLFLCVDWNYFLSAWWTSFSLFCKTSLQATNFPNHCLFGNIFILVGRNSPPPPTPVASTLNTSSEWFWCPLCLRTRQASISLFEVHLYVMVIFFPASFKISYSLSFQFDYVGFRCGPLRVYPPCILLSFLDMYVFLQISDYFGHYFFLIHIYVYTCIYLCVCVYTHTHIYIFTCIYICYFLSCLFRIPIMYILA